MKDGQTIGQWLNWDFEAKGNFEIRDKRFNLVYWERSDESWGKYEHDSEGNETYYLDSRGYWEKREYDSNGFRIYYEDSSGVIKDKRPPEVIEHNGRKYKLIP